MINNSTNNFWFNNYNKNQKQKEIILINSKHNYNKNQIIQNNNINYQQKIMKT